MVQARQTIDATNLSRSLLTALQQEVDLGTQALKNGSPDVAVTFFQSALQKMSAEMPFYDHLVHNLLLSYRDLAKQLIGEGKEEMALKFVESALSLELRGEMAEDAGFRQRFAEVFQALSVILFKYAKFDLSVECVRKAMRVHRFPSDSINLTNSLSAAGQPARLSDFTTDITPEQLGRHIFIACVPKSASTFLKNLLISLTGYRDMFSVYAAGQTEHELYLPTVREFAHFDTVTQQHCRASDANVHMMQAFGIRPVVLVRNIFDSVMSLLDFYNKQGAYFNTYFRGDFASLDEETKIDLLIDNVIPWYLQFMASWELVEKQRRLQIHWLTYEELIGEKASAIQKVLNFYGLGAYEKALESKIRETERESRKIRFNKGVAGRGNVGLSNKQKDRIRHLTRYYPSTDFGRMGL
jgi:tetratricopeptide (TPR) repeat protein